MAQIRISARIESLAHGIFYTYNRIFSAYNIIPASYNRYLRLTLGFSGLTYTSPALTLGFKSLTIELFSLTDAFLGLTSL